jgi:butyrate kinase
VISGGMARSKMLVDKIKARVARLAPVVVFPQNLELEAMARGVLGVLRGQQEAKQYRRESLSVL